ncbi:hypothetical protein ATO11_04335 [Pseudaestuariivita atlantica]|uniref:Uncharacterized protein n=1 Tax=Pseudaestuariivita atlantica TaxID=1317121 RepID=A0A0L1JSF3_9RHOB|nr:hypothetical protein ATO11_04335 [Pseudaestuariivita atlantica]
MTRAPTKRFTLIAVEATGRPAIQRNLELTNCSGRCAILDSVQCTIIKTKPREILLQLQDTLAFAGTRLHKPKCIQNARGRVGIGGRSSKYQSDRNCA